MAASVTAVREALAAALATVEGLRPHAFIPDNIVPPAAIIAPAQGTFLTYDSSFSGGSDDMRFIIQLLVSTASDRAGQENLDAYLAAAGDKSVKAAVEDDPSLGGIVDSVAVAEASNYGKVSLEGTEYFGCEFAVEVLA